jgi:SDR family mycofactocin-dependent oxidoreductase
MTGDGRVAIVTGAARGIGAATVSALVAGGWSVLAVDIAADDPAIPYPLARRDDLDAVVAAAPDPDRIASYVADVRDVTAVEAAVAEAERRWGGLDAAIACAGAIIGGKPLPEISIEAEQAVIDINLGGTLKLARAAIPALRRRPEPRSGRFIAIASAAATRGLPLLAAYCAAKAGIAGLVRSLGTELGPHGITANAISPGSTGGAMLAESARLYGLPEAEMFAAQQPIGRLLAPAEIAAMIVFLAGADSGGITGAVVPVDGGLAL